METHTFELRLNKFDHKKEPSSWTEILYKGNSYEECKTELSEICKKIGYDENCNFALTNGGYKIVDLAKERIRRIKEHGVELLETLKEAKTIIYNLCNNLEKRSEIELQSILDTTINKVLGDDK